MAIVSPTLGMVYYDITKIASSSLKILLWEIENGRPFPSENKLQRFAHRWRARLLRDDSRKPGNLHNDFDWIKTRAFDPDVGAQEDYHRFTVVRDPIQRLLSAWKDKVNRKQFGRRPAEIRALRQEGLPVDPSFGEFIDHFEAYRQISRPARIHSTSYAWHLGEDLSFFDSVHRLEQMDVLLALFSQRLGRPVSLPRSNASQKERRSSALTVQQLDRLIEITAPDYMLLSDLYDPETAVRHLRRLQDARGS